MPTVGIARQKSGGAGRGRGAEGRGQGERELGDFFTSAPVLLCSPALLRPRSSANP